LVGVDDDEVGGVRRGWRRRRRRKRKRRRRSRSMTRIW
jgi:hypothetical protein